MDELIKVALNYLLPCYCAYSPGCCTSFRYGSVNAPQGRRNHIWLIWWCDIDPKHRLSFIWYCWWNHPNSNSVTSPPPDNKTCHLCEVLLPSRVQGLRVDAILYGHWEHCWRFLGLQTRQREMQVLTLPPSAGGAALYSNDSPWLAGYNMNQLASCFRHASAVAWQTKRTGLWMPPVALQEEGKWTTSACSPAVYIYWNAGWCEITGEGLWLVVKARTWNCLADRARSLVYCTGAPGRVLRGINQLEWWSCSWIDLDGEVGMWNMELRPYDTLLFCRVLEYAVFPQGP